MKFLLKCYYAILSALHGIKIGIPKGNRMYFNIFRFKKQGKTGERKMGARGFTSAGPKQNFR